MTDIEFGQAVRIKRTELGMSQQDLARKAKISNTTVCAAENAQKQVQPKTKLALAIALGVDPKEWM